MPSNTTSPGLALSCSPVVNKGISMLNAESINFNPMSRRQA